MNMTKEQKTELRSIKGIERAMRAEAKTILTNTKAAAKPHLAAIREARFYTAKANQELAKLDKSAKRLLAGLRKQGEALEKRRLILEGRLSA
jgi:hypothetical protein